MLNLYYFVCRYCLYHQYVKSSVATADGIPFKMDCRTGGTACSFCLQKSAFQGEESSLFNRPFNSARTHLNLRTHASSTLYPRDPLQYLWSLLSHRIVLDAWQAQLYHRSSCACANVPHIQRPGVGCTLVRIGRSFSARAVPP